MQVLKFEGVSFAYEDNIVVDDVTFEIDKGDYVGLIGPNGSGKSTLVKLCLGLLKPNKGEISLFGAKIEKFSEWKKIGYVPQYLQANKIPFAVTVGEVLSMTGAGNDELKQITKLLELEEAIINRPVDKLSGGQKQKVYIARALIHDPQLLILDEPTTGVDRESEAYFYDMLEKFHKLGKTIILVSHDISTVASEVSHLLCMNRKLVCHGRPEQVMRQSWEELFGSHKIAVKHNH